MFAMLNEKGYYDLYDATGDKLGMLVSTMRITQKAGDVDKIVIIAPVNVVRNKEEMQNVING
jgi:hypothetical protein